jgi:hypothetical protein
MLHSIACQARASQSQGLKIIAEKSSFGRVSGEQEQGDGKKSVW